MEQTLQIGIFGDSISKGIVLDAETHRYSSLKKEITEWISPSTALHNFSVMGSTIQKGLSIITRHTDQLASYQNVFLETTAILTGVPFQNDRRHTMNRILH